MESQQAITAMEIKKNQEVETAKPNRLVRFVKENWRGATLFLAFCLVATFFQGNIVSAATTGGDAVSTISTGLTTAESPVMQLLSSLGRFLLIVAIGTGAVMQMLGRELSSKGKSIWLSALFGAVVLINAGTLRDFVWTTFGQNQG